MSFFLKTFIRVLHLLKPCNVVETQRQQASQQRLRLTGVASPTSPRELVGPGSGLASYGPGFAGPGSGLAGPGPGLASPRGPTHKEGAISPSHISWQGDDDVMTRSCLLLNDDVFQFPPMTSSECAGQSAFSSHMCKN